MKALRCFFAGIAVMLLFIVCIMMLTGMRAFAYETAEADIPVYCLRCTTDGSRDYRLLLEPADDRSPQPEKKDIITGEDSTVRFRIDITEPGTYTYRLSQIPGDMEDTVYDETVYKVTVYTEDKGGRLLCAVTAEIDGADTKADRIQFGNEVKLPVQVTETTTAATELTTTSTETQTTGDPGTETTSGASETTVPETQTTSAAATTGAQVTVIPADSAKTGDTTDAGELAAVMAAAGAAAVITRKRRKT